MSPQTTPQTIKDPSAPGFKQKAARELKEFLIIAAYLAFFLCALITYTNLLLKKHDLNVLNYSFAIINALIVAKIILIGQMMHFGRSAEARPLYQTVLYKSFVFGLLVFAFHILEEFIKRLIHHESNGTVLHNLHLDDLTARSIIIFCAFLPLFAFIEIRRIIGEEKFYALLLHRRTPETP
jgi:hypothetical protein